MKIIQTLLRFVLAFIVGIVGFIAVLMALAYKNLSFINASGAAFFGELTLGAVMLWAAWRLIRGCIARQVEKVIMTKRSRMIPALVLSGCDLELQCLSTRPGRGVFDELNMADGCESRHTEAPATRITMDSAR